MMNNEKDISKELQDFYKDRIHIIIIGKSIGL